MAEETREKNPSGEQTAAGPDDKAATDRPDERLSPKDIDYQPPLVICLSIISRLLGRPVSSATLKAGIPQQEKVITAASMVRAADKIGISAKTVHRPEVQSITRLVMPCILLLRGGNACVLVDFDDTTARVLLPGHGMTETEIALEKLDEEYTGYAIFCRRKSRLDARASKLRLVKAKRWFWDVILRFWPVYRHVIAASIMTNLIIVASPLFIMNVYDRVIPNNALDTLWALAIGIGIATSSTSCSKTCAAISSMWRAATRTCSSAAG
ncbi:cysteine peptidase family C39 domain-containing protein [Salidesulfovibrio brasiliensis]|uniref:cysteine peptidase family C39 domain-containing protein n=1 Tax=Salidesulfovibrio brasiliensis TaxID=221711 RepID=UPI000A6A13AD|nr:cysteine peptidase family C39 domain-containing protein [Salidesulfovibrio brasiliensis]